MTAALCVAPHSTCTTRAFLSLYFQPDGHTGTDVTTTISATNAAATGDTAERDTRPERTRTAPTEPNNTTSAMPRC